MGRQLRGRAAAMLTAAVALTAGTVSAFAGGASATTSHPALRPQAATGGIIKFGETPGSPPN